MKPSAETESEAAAWLARRDGGVWGPSDEAAFQQWLSASTANRIAFIRLESVWSKAGRLRALGAGPVVARNGPEAEDADIPRRTPGPAKRPRRWFMPGVAAAALAVLAVPGWRMLDGPDEALSTPVGGFQRRPLADGSRVELNTDTELEVAFDSDRREVRLDRGEAFFDVAHDPDRPFIVAAGPYRVIAVGTAFSVRRLQNAISVAVTEGRVRVDRADRRTEPAFVAAGHRVEVAREELAVRTASPHDLEEALSWRDGLLTFDSRALGDVAAEFNRYNRRHLLVDPSAADVTVSGTFRANNVDGFLRLLKQGFDVDAIGRGRDEVVLKRR